MILMKTIFNNKETEITKDMVGVYAVYTGENFNYIYIGSGKLADRISGNASKLRRNVHANKRLQQAYNNMENPECKIEVIGVCDTDEEARMLEQDFINYANKIDGLIVCNVRKANNGATSKAYNKHSRLTEEDASQIKELIKQGYSNKQLAYEFNCSSNAISKIRNGNRWVNA